MSWGRALAVWLVAGLLIAVCVADLQRVAPPTPAAVPAVQPTGPAAVELPHPARAIEIRRGQEVVAWERAENGWHVTAPAGRAIPGGLLDAFAEQLASIGLGEHFDGAGGDQAFGLDSPKLRIAVVGEDGRRAALIVGERTPTGTSAYARREEGGAVLLVGLNLVYYSDLLFDAAR